MSWNASYSSSFEKDVDALPRKVRELIPDIIASVLSNPYEARNWREVRIASASISAIDIGWFILSIEGSG